MKLDTTTESYEQMPTFIFTTPVYGVNTPIQDGLHFVSNDLKLTD